MLWRVPRTIIHQSSTNQPTYRPPLLIARSLRFATPLLLARRERARCRAAREETAQRTTTSAEPKPSPTRLKRASTTNILRFVATFTKNDEQHYDDDVDHDERCRLSRRRDSRSSVFLQGACGAGSCQQSEQVARRFCAFSRRKSAVQSPSNAHSRAVV